MLISLKSIFLYAKKTIAQVNWDIRQWLCMKPLSLLRLNRLGLIRAREKGEKGAHDKRLFQN